MTIQNDNLPDDDFRGLLASAFRVADGVMKPGAAFYIWHADSEGLNFRNACKAVGWQVRQCLIWNKNALVLGRQDYQWKHEPCLYGWKEGAGHYFFDSRNETTVVEDAESVDIKKMKKDEMARMLRDILSSGRATSVIDCPKPASSTLHPTMKPIRLFGYLMRNSSRPGETVLDLFGGSGTTIIAAEQMGRKAYVMELDPHYCDVIIARWEKETGLTAEKIA